MQFGKKSSKEGEKRVRERELGWRRGVSEHKGPSGQETPRLCTALLGFTILYCYERNTSYMDPFRQIPRANYWLGNCIHMAALHLQNFLNQDEGSLFTPTHAPAATSPRSGPLSELVVSHRSRHGSPWLPVGS